MPVLQNQNPAAMAKRVPHFTGVYLEIYDADNVDAASVIVYIDLAGDGNYELAYSGGSFQGSYTGSVDTADPTTFKLTFNPVSTDDAAPVHVNVYTEDGLGNPMDATYWFKTLEYPTPIYPIYPRGDERLVSTDTGLVIAFQLEDPVTVTVAGTLAYDDGLVPKFRNGWNGSYLDDVDGKRLILDPPAVFAINTNVLVEVTTASNSWDYTFRVGSQQITTTGDVRAPKITEATSSELWIGYTRAGELVLRKGSPPSAEVTVIAAGEWDHGYNPTLGKYILIWIDNGKVFYSAADPADPPEVLAQPSVANAQVSLGPGGSAAKEFLDNRTEPINPVSIRTVPPAALEILIFLPTGEPEADQIVGFRLYKYIHGRHSQIATVAASPGQTYATYIDTGGYAEGVQYSARPIYEAGGNVYEGPLSVPAPPAEYGDVVAVAPGGSSGRAVFAIEYFPPLQFVRLDEVRVASGSSWGEVFEISSYENLEYLPTPDSVKTASGSGHRPILIGSGFGIIGVG